MSRNFELMQNLGKEQEMFQASTEATTVEETVSTGQPVELQPLQLKMEDAQRDEIFKLVQRVFLMPGEKSRVVVVSGMEPGNGCSWICARMAEVLAAQTSGTVCVVDANLRSPGLHREFGVPNHYGLTDALQVIGSDPEICDFVVAAEPVAAELRRGSGRHAEHAGLGPHAVTVAGVAARV